MWRGQWGVFVDKWYGVGSGLHAGGRCAIVCVLVLCASQLGGRTPCELLAWESADRGVVLRAMSLG